jgi:hypothetical protein
MHHRGHPAAEKRFWRDPERGDGFTQNPVTIPVAELSTTGEGISSLKAGTQLLTAVEGFEL